MREAREILDEQFLQMRALCLRLAADFDRIQRSDGGDKVMGGEARIALLRQAMAIACDDRPERAARLEALLSEK